MKRKWMLMLPVAAFLGVALLFGVQPNREGETAAQFQGDREILETLAQQMVEEGELSTEEVPAPWRGGALYDHDLPTVQFDLGASGLGSETVYWGMNYVPADEPVGFQGQRWDYWKQDGDGRMYYDPEGDNTCYVKKLDDCWYYFEMHF